MKKLRFPRWTGFNGRTLFDWLGVIAIPLFLGLLTFLQWWIAEEREKQDEMIAEKNRLHTVMSSYLDQMTKLLIEYEANATADQEVQNDIQAVARAITLNASRQLDGERRGQLLKFLYESELIGQCPFELVPQSDQAAKKEADCKRSRLSLDDIKLEEATFFNRRFSMAGADLRGAFLDGAHLPGVTLAKAVMNAVNLPAADLTGAVLNDAHMDQAVLSHAQLTDAFLIGTKLSNANLSNANLIGANLKRADLEWADLKGANLTGANLEGANLQNALYNAAPAYDKDGKVEFVPTQFPQGFNPVKAGMLLEKCTLGKCVRDNQEDR